MSRKTALITGVGGQDGAYLSRLLVEKDYRVVGAMRRNSQNDRARLEQLGVADKIEFLDMDLSEGPSILRAIKNSQPDEVYNLGAQSFVGSSWATPEYAADVNGLGVLRVLEALREYAPEARFYQASTSEMFGLVAEVPQSETTPFHPRSPYGVAKVYGHNITVNYRESFDAYLCAGILFNHESPLRGIEFVTRKITRAMATMAQDTAAPAVKLGNVNARRDWGFAGDYVEGMWMMLQQDTPEDYVLATGVTTTVRDFVSFAAQAAGFTPEWSGEEVDEICVDGPTGRQLVTISPEFYRPAEVELLLGDPTKANTQLGWKATCTVEQLATMMVEADLT